MTGQTAKGERTSDDVPPALAIEMMVPVVRALAHAHAHGIVHRDLKPSNIILADAGVVKVLDFGIAKLLGTHETPGDADDPAVEERDWQTAAGSILGTMPYMSPEQWRGREVDARSDLWAVGVMLHLMLTGRHPLHPLTRQRLQTVADLEQPMPRLGKRRPELGALAAVIDRCLEKDRERRYPSADELLAELESLLPQHQLQLAEDENPYPGLFAFQAADSARFFGRDRDVARLLSVLRHQALVAITGPSGAGKSSFVRAGLIPALQRLAEGWDPVVIRPGRHPLDALGTAVADITGEGGDHDVAWADDFRAQPGRLGAVLRARCRKRGRRILLFVDQAEELYTLCTSGDERSAFAASLEGAADDPSSPLRVVLALRSDFLDQLADGASFAPEIARGLYFLPPMDRPRVRQALTEPARRAGHDFEDDELVDDMLDSLATTRSPLPLLQFTAARLWESRDRERKLLTVASYRQLGGIGGALAGHADSVLAAMSAAERALARAIFLCLVTAERTRAVVPLEELRELGAVAQVERVLGQLADARLVFREAAEPGGSSIELVHESLITRWPALAQWLNETTDDAQFRARLHAAAREWHRQGRTDDLLWRGQAAEEAARFLARQRRQPGAGRSMVSGEYGARDLAYLRAVTALASRSRRRRRQAVIGALCFLALVAIAVSLLAVRANRSAAHAERQASETARHAARAERESVQARNASRIATAREKKSDPTLALALIRELEGPTLPRGWDQLARSALQAGVARTVFAHPDTILSLDVSPDGTLLATGSTDHLLRLWRVDGTSAPRVLAGHEGDIWRLAFDHTGTRLATASFDHTARLWHLDSKLTSSRSLQHDGAVYSVAFSPDGTRLLTASSDRTARISSLGDIIQTERVLSHPEEVYAANFHPGGNLVVTGGGDAIVRLFDQRSREPVAVFDHHSTGVNWVEFDPTGERIVSASWDQTVQVFRADNSVPPRVLRGHTGGILNARFDRTGTRVVSGGQDNTARVWRLDRDTGGDIEPWRQLSGHQKLVHTVAFIPGTDQVVTGSLDRRARVWDLTDRHRPQVLHGHERRVDFAAFNHDASLVVTASHDWTARVWTVEDRSDRSARMPQLLRGHTDVLFSASFSPDGTHIITASQDDTARIWRTDGTGIPLVLGSHEDPVDTAMFSPDGRRIVTACSDGIARIWNADGTGQPVVLEGHEAQVTYAVFSPDGALVATASRDHTARVWNLQGEQMTVIRGHQDWLESVAFSPDGRSLITGSNDQSARIWPLQGGHARLTLTGHDGAVGVRGGRPFHPDGSRVLTHSEDHTIRMWDPRSGQQLMVFRGPAAQVSSAAFSPDGTRIVAAFADGTAWVWSKLPLFSAPDDSSLWAATDYCLSIDERKELLGVPDYVARANLERCQARAAAARPQKRGHRSGGATQ